MQFKLEDFETYRYRLKRYAEGLLLTKGTGGSLFSNVSHIADDIVQNCYLKFHLKNELEFESDKHFFNFLKRILYYSYRYQVDDERTLNKYSSLKACNLQELDLESHPLNEIHMFEEDWINKFKSKLTKHQSFILNKLLLGYISPEIAKELNVSNQSIHADLKCIRNKYNKMFNGREGISVGC